MVKIRSKFYGSREEELTALRVGIPLKEAAGEMKSDLATQSGSTAQEECYRCENNMSNFIEARCPKVLLRLQAVEYSWNIKRACLLDVCIQGACGMIKQKCFLESLAEKSRLSIQLPIVYQDENKHNEEKANKERRRESIAIFCSMVRKRFYFTWFLSRDLKWEGELYEHLGIELSTIIVFVVV